MASTDAKPFPLKNTAYRVTLPILDADGDLVTGATGLDSEISKDGGTFADCTNEATEIATASGMYYLDLTSTEMNADTVAIIVKTTSSGAKTTALVLYPLESGDIPDVASIKAKTDALPSDPADASDIAASFATLNSTLSTLSGYVDTEVAAIKAKTDALPTDPADASDIAASFSTVNTTLATISGYIDTEVAAIKAKTDALPTDPADASDIAASFTTVNSTLATISGYVDTEVAAIKAKTDALPADPASASSIAASFAVTNGKVDAVDDYIDTEVAAIKAKTDQLTFTGGKVDANATTSIVAGDLTAIADAILKRDWTALTGEAAYSLLNAARMLRNVWNTTGGTLTVHKEDGTTTAWTRTLATDPSAEPIIGAS